MANASSERGRIEPRHFDTVETVETERWGPGGVWLAILGIIVALLGVALIAGGAWLIALGGVVYYLVAGLLLLASGVLIFLRRRSGVVAYIIAFLFSIIWGVSEVGLHIWPLIPWTVAPTVLLIVVLLSLPAFHRTIVRRRTGVIATTAATVFLLVGGSAAVSLSGHTLGSRVALAQDAAPSSPENPALEQNATPPAVQPPSPSTPTVSPQNTPPIAEIQSTDATIPDTGARISTTPLQRGEVGKDWPAYGGTDLAQRYSPLDQINAGNVANLRQVWLAHTGDMPTAETKDKFSPENTPLAINGSLYVCSAMNIIIAYDAATGQEKWRHDPKVPPQAIPYGATCRGVSYYAAPASAATADCKARIIEATLDARLIAVDAETGQPCAGFGDNGQVDLNRNIGQSVPGWYAVTGPPTIVRGIIVTGAQVRDGQAEDAPSGVVRGYDAITGKLAWAWDMGQPDRTGAPPDNGVYTRGTPNMWTIAAGDEELGYVYLPMGNSSVDYYGGNRKDYENRYSSALVALDVTTGKPVWSFQTVHYDLWDYDLGSQPSLIDFPTDSGSVPAVILPSKQGEIYVLDRRTGKSLFPVIEKPAPAGGVEPENLSKTQPYSGYATLAKPPLKPTNAWGASPLDQLWCRIEFRRAAYEGEYTPPTADRPFIQYPGYNGGSDWGSVAVDTKNGILVANYNDVPNYNRLIPRTEADKMGVRPITEGGNPPGAEAGAQAGSPYAIDVNAGWRNPVTGMPCVSPPYGWIRAIDLKTGKTLWDQPFGDATNNGPFGIPSNLPIPIGTPNNGGPLVTAGGLIFIAATTDDKFRAIDIHTGKVVWETTLPAGGQSTPMTYEVDGRQYVVLAPGGHHFMETKIGDQIIAYALPR